MSPTDINMIGMGVSAFAAGYIFAHLESMLIWAWQSAVARVRS